MVCVPFLLVRGICARFVPIYFLNSSFQVVWRKVGISHCGLDVLVSKEFLNCCQVNSGHYQEGCKGVTEAVKGDMAYTCSFGCPVQSMSDVIKPVSALVALIAHP